MNIKDQLKDYIARNLLFSDNGFQYDDDASFLEEGIVDSISVLELVAFVDETFVVEVEDHEVTPGNFDSFNNLKASFPGKLNNNSCKIFTVMRVKRDPSINLGKNGV
jgi:acyl carrier protein